MSESKYSPDDPALVCSVTVQEFEGGKKSIQIMAPSPMYAAGLLGYVMARIHADVYAKDKREAESAIAVPKLVIPGLPQ